MSDNSTKRFDTWDEVNCNECSRYWDDSCDAVSQGSRRLCNSFLATRSVVIPAQLNALKTKVKGLYWTVVLNTILVTWLLIEVIMRG